MTQHQLFVSAFFVVLLVLLYQMAIIFAPFLVPVLWAVIIARMSNALYLKLVHLLRGRDTLAAGLLTFATMFLVVFPIVCLTFLLVQETVIAYRSVEEWVRADGLKQLPGIPWQDSSGWAVYPGTATDIRGGGKWLRRFDRGGDKNCRGVSAWSDVRSCP